MSKHSDFSKSLNNKINKRSTANKPKPKPKAKHNPPPRNCTCRTTHYLACPYHSGDDEGKDYD